MAPKRATDSSVVGKCPDWIWGPRRLLCNVLGALANHSPQSSAEVKNEWRYTSIPPCLRGVHGTTLPLHLQDVCKALRFFFEVEAIQQVLLGKSIEGREKDKLTMIYAQGGEGGRHTH